MTPTKTPRVIRRRIMSAVLILLVLLAGWRLNWIGFKRDWPEATGWASIPEAQRSAETSDRLPSLRAGWPVLHWSSAMATRTIWCP
jgi:hypothetical protein